jgi:AraC family transcriptional regulator
MTKSQMKKDEAPWGQLEPPRFENGKPLLIAGLRSHYAAAPWQGVLAQWQRFQSICSTLTGSHLDRIPGQVGRTTYGLCFLLPNGVDYLSGVEVSGSSSLPDEFRSVSIPAQRYVVFPHREHVSKLHNTCEMVSKWLPTSAHEVAKGAGAPDFFERYGENFDPRAGTGDIEVWIPIKA